MNIDLTQLQQLIHIAETANIDELEINDGEQNIRIVCRTSASPTEAGTMPKKSSLAMNPATVIPNSKPTPIAQPTPDLASNNAPTTPSQTTITAPMIGTFYLRANPEATPFVAVNDSVTVNQTLCIIEAMKIMHEVKAEKAGKITQILAKEGDMVEYGQPLFVIE